MINGGNMDKSQTIVFHLDKNCSHYNQCVAIMVMEMLARSGDRMLNGVRDCLCCNIRR